MMAKDHTQLIVRQQPTRAQVVQENNPKNRKPIDPPPIIELKYDDRNDHNNAQWLVSPRTFMMVTLINVKEGEEHMPGKYLIGQTVSSLHRLKDINNKDGGFFVFGDISAKKLGMYKLRFSLFDTDKDTEQVVFMKAVDSEPFPVVPQRDFGSMSESTHLTRTFSDQGVKLRVRKDNRAISGIGTKRPYQASPPETSSPSTNTLYGGAVQDHYGSSMQSPVVKRQRSSSEYGGSFYSSLPHTDSSLSHYSSTLPSTGQRTYGGDHQHIHGYGQQSPLGPPTMGRSVQTPSQSSYHQHLPSPTPSMTNSQHLSFPGASSQQGSYSYGEPGATGAMSSVPRNPYFAYQPQATYQTPSSSDLSQPYPGINMAVTSVADASSLAAPNSQPFGISPYETGDEAGPYGSYDNARYG